MNIVSMNIKNFKTFRELTINFNENFNVLIGQNNIGKTTIIEAMQLWKKCYDLNVQVKEDKFYATSKNISFSEFEFLRIADAKDLFHTTQRGKMSIEIMLTIQSDENIYHLGFRITKPGHINNAYFQVEYIEKEEFTNFEKNASEIGVKLSKMIAFSSTRPLSNIVVKEPYMNIGQVRSKINKGKGYEVLRNKIIKDRKIKKDIEEHLKNIFQKNIEFIETGGNSKEYIKLLVSIDGEKSDVLAQGSGFLQIVDIFSSFEFSDAQLYILLIDEPDSHIHADLQSKLISQFRTISKSQIFVITHNEKFMNNVADQEIIFVNDSDKANGFLKPLEPGCIMQVKSTSCCELKIQSLSEKINLRSRKCVF